MNLRTLNDEELLRHARAEINSLISTPLELELLDRFESLLDVQSVHEPIADLLDEYEIDASVMREMLDAMLIDPANTVALLNVLAAADIDAPESLKAELDLAKQFRAIVKDAGDVFSRLNNLVTTHQE